MSKVRKPRCRCEIAFKGESLRSADVAREWSSILGTWSQKLTGVLEIPNDVVMPICDMPTHLDQYSTPGVNCAPGYASFSGSWGGGR
jgi:hypothetical protein